MRGAESGRYRLPFIYYTPPKPKSDVPSFPGQSIKTKRDVLGGRVSGSDSRRSVEKLCQNGGCVKKPLVSLERAKGFEPSAQNSQAIQPQEIPQGPESGYTQIRAQILGQGDCELAQVAQAWPTLSQPLKAAVLSIVAASKAEKDGTA